jgi:hypothetical protein
MNQSITIPFNKEVYYRLIALWVLCESVLGGIIHGFKLPVSGLLVGSSAVICICLIAYYVPVKGAILKATLLVAIFKLMLSPHTPLPAYFAVFFQGFAGELLFLNPRNYKITCMLLAIIALLESASQRILIMTFVYGTDIWKALNDVAKNLSNNSSINFSFYIIASYLLLHLLVGIVIGWFAASLPGRSARWNILHKDLIIPFQEQHATIHSATAFRKRKKVRKALLVVWILLIALFLQSYLGIGRVLLPSHISLQILLRSIVILLTWYFVLSPILSKFLKQWLLKRRVQSQAEVNAVLQLLPSTKYILIKSWQLTSSFKGISRLSQYCKIVFVNTLHA